MKVKELIANLTLCDLDMEVYIWVDGSRYPIETVDDNLSDCVDLNAEVDRKSTRLNSSHIPLSRMPSSA